MQSYSRSQQLSRQGLSRVEVVVTISVVGFLLLMIAPTIQDTRRPRRRMECQVNLKNIALATMQYASLNGGRIPFLEDGQFGWPAALLPYLDSAALSRSLRQDPIVVEKEWQKTKQPMLLKILTCPVDTSNAGKHLGLSYVANAGWGRFLADPMTDSVRESNRHTADIDWNQDGQITEEERRLARATGLFWRPHEDGFQLTLDEVSEGDGQSQTMLFIENTNARNWLSRETFDIAAVVDLDRIGFEPMNDGPLNLNAKSAKLGPFAIQPKPRVLPGRSPVPSSNHVGIFNVAFADGRVESHNFNIDPRVHLAQMTWDGVRYGEDRNRNFE
ncbi:MAG: DUF1559 domain-containing protein [Planctomycetia bacterium]|nr:DUF1559 domain-containing protein [Planctomycetia bacterium]